MHVPYCTCYYVFNRLKTATLEITHNLRYVQALQALRLNFKQKL